MVEFPKFLIKMKNCKTFYEAQTASRFKKIIQPPPTHNPTLCQIKSSCISGTKVFFRRYAEIYRHLLSKCFQNVVLRRHEMVQCKRYFWHQTEPIFARKLVKSDRVLAVLREHTVFNVK